MTVAVVQELHNTLAGTPLTVSQAANFTMGDWLYAWCLDNSAGGTLHAPDPLADWSLVPSSNIVSGNMEAAWYYRRVAAGEGKDAVLDVTGSTQLQLQVYEVSGGGLPGTAVTTGPTSTNALLSGSVTPANGGLVLVGYVRLGTVSGNGSYSNSFVADIAAAVRIAASGTPRPASAPRRARGLWIWAA